MSALVFSYAHVFRLMAVIKSTWMSVTKDRSGAPKISVTWIASRNSLPLAIFPSRSWNKKAQLLWKARPFFSDRLPFVTMASRSSYAVISREVYFEWSRRDFGEQADVAEKMGLGKQTRELRVGRDPPGGCSGAGAWFANRAHNT